MMKVIFSELVNMEGSGVGLHEAEKIVMVKYNLSVTTVRYIKLKGIYGDWLSEMDGF